MVELAARVAQQHLAEPLPRRWRHVQAVAAKAEQLGRVIVPEDRDLLTASAWLHDIGYAPNITDTGLHALDGARWLVREGFPSRLAGLVANHSCATYEADERGLSEILVAEFPQERSATARHADVKITLKVYAHANLDAMREALGKLDGRLS
jgi:putative nucleotidyltransferase with HDIG domain